MLKSSFLPLVKINLPSPKGRQVRYHTFDLARPTVPEGFEDYLAPLQLIVKASGAKKGQAHLTIDEKVVKKGMSQRRPRPHVDGCFIPAGPAGYWGHGGGGSGWLHFCNSLKGTSIARMPVIVVSNEPGCRAWTGEFEGEPKEDGDLSHISDQLGEGEVLPPHVAYLLSPDCVHESMILEEDTPRTFLRVAMPVGFEMEGR